MKETSFLSIFLLITSFLFSQEKQQLNHSLRFGINGAFWGAGDIFGKTIPSGTLDDLITTYISFGDVAVIEDLIIRNFLNSSEAVIPSDSEMRADVNSFIKKNGS